MEPTAQYTRSEGQRIMTFTPLKRWKCSTCPIKRKRMHLMRWGFWQVSINPTWLLIKRHLSTSPALVCGKFIFSIYDFVNKALWWNMPIMETSSKKFAVIKRGRPILRRRRYGTFSYRLLEGLRLCMIGKFCIETWSPPTFFCIGTCKQS